jgi:LPXTG-site transpeptidase (sortase) family protein
MASRWRSTPSRSASHVLGQVTYIGGCLLVGIGIGLLALSANQLLRAELGGTDEVAAAAQEALLAADGPPPAEAPLFRPTEGEGGRAPVVTLAEAPVVTTAADPVVGVPPQTTGPPPAAAPEPPPPGGRVATLSFSRVIDVEYAVVEGTDRAALQHGPGRYRSSSLPGQPGNFAVAGHRTTYGSPFADIDQLRRGDRILVRDEAGRRFSYRVVESRIVAPSDTWVIGADALQLGRPLLTLTTCHPRYSARQRLIVWAELDLPASSPQ